MFRRVNGRVDRPPPSQSLPRKHDDLEQPSSSRPVDARETSPDPASVDETPARPAMPSRGRKRKHKATASTTSVIDNSDAMSVAKRSKMPLSVEEQLAETKQKNAEMNDHLAHLTEKLQRANMEITHFKQQFKTAHTTKDQLNDQLVQAEAKMKSVTDTYHRLRMDALFERVHMGDKHRKEMDRERARLAGVHLANLKDFKQAQSERTAELQRSYLQMVREARQETERQTNMYESMIRQYEAAHSSYLNCEIELCNEKELIKGLQADLYEVSDFKIDERKAIEEKDLPPAYDKRNDDENLPPWRVHVDACPATVDNIEDGAHEQWTEFYITAMRAADNARSDPKLENRSSVGRYLFATLTLVLSKTCFTLNTIHDVPSASSSQNDRLVRSYRIIDAIIDACWQFVAAFEIRPTHVTVIEAYRMTLDMEWRHIDAVLKKAIDEAYKCALPAPDDDGGPVCRQCRNRKCPGYCVRMNDMQVYLGKLRVLQGKFKSLTDKFEYLMLSCECLDSFLESDLVSAARE